MAIANRLRCIRIAIAVLIGAAGPSRAETLAKGAATAGRSVRVAVDPRTELVSIIFRLAGNPEYNRGKVESYSKDVEKHFGPFRDHEAVKLARQLRQTRGVSYDACMSLAVHLDGPTTVAIAEPLDPWPVGIDKRWTAPAIGPFLDAARRFVKDADFEKFFAERAPLYRLTESRFQEVLDRDARLDWFDDFFGARAGADFTVILGPLNGGQNYGPRRQLSGGKEDLYCILGVWKVDQAGMPQFDKSVLEIVVHEFCHSYANAIVDAHLKELEPAGMRMFPFVAAAMRRQAYANWHTMMRESLVRACVIRYVDRHNGPAAAAKLAAEEKSRSFHWASDLAALLAEYEKDRKTYPTLDSFAPKLVAFFDDYSRKFAKRQEEIAKKRPNVVSINLQDGANDVDPATDKIVVVFDRPMADRSWSIVGGGPHFPEIVGKPAYDAKRTTWTVGIKLKPGWDYEFMLNSERFLSFKSADGTPLEPMRFRFSTKK